MVHAVFGSWRPLAWLLVVMALGASEASARDPRVSVTPFASVKAIQPGQPFELALRFEIEDKWHIYWKNSGDSGLPPEVRWDLPDGFRASELEHPVPSRYKDRSGLTTFIHEGSPILTATITPPPDLRAGSSVQLKGEAIYLACKTICVRGTKPFALRLPLAEPGAPPAPDHKAVFEEARAAFPQPASQAKYLRLRPAVNVDRIRPGDRFKLGLALDVAKGYHIQSHKPLAEYLIATDVFLEDTEDIWLSEPSFPEHEVRTLPGGLKVAEHSGRVLIQFDGEADNTISHETVRFAGILRYQACDEKGQCFPPQNIAWAVEVPAGEPGEAVTIVNRDIFAAATPPAGEQDPAADAAPAAPEATADSGLGKRDAAAEGSFVRRFGLAGLLVGCFLYGLFLNATPCVLPLLSIKVLGFVQQAHESRRRTLLLGLSFGAGVVLFFVLLGFVAAAGKNILQYPAAVIGLSAVVMALALSMLGVYTLRAPSAAAELEAHLQQESVWASFAKGALAPILGFACTGPLLAGAFGWATQQTPLIAVVAFVAAGVGMAAPYVLLGANPKWLSFIPKPGPWMVTFERIMGFLLLGMVVWLLHPVVSQLGVAGLELTLVFFVVIGMGCWLLGKIDLSMSAARRWAYRGGAAALVAVSGLLIYGWAYAKPAAEVRWQNWSPEMVENAVRSGKTVLVDFTAAYCTVCKANKKLAFDTPEVVTRISEMGILTLQGDFTSGDPQIAALLKRYDRAGVPLNLIYPAGKPDEPIVLRPNLSKAYLLEKLEEAGPSRTVLLSGVRRHPS